MSSSEKNYSSGLRVLEVLKILLQEDVKKSELIEKLSNIEDVDGVYTNEVFTKYFNTLDMAGLKIERDKNTYYLKNALFQINLSDKEKDLLLAMINEVNYLRNDNQKSLFYKTFKRLNKYFYPPFSKSEIEKQCVQQNTFEENSINEQLILKVENLLYDNQLVEIEYQKSKNIIDKLVVEIKSLTGKGNKTVIKCYCPKLARNKNIPINSVIKLNQLPKKAQGTSCLNPVVFELYGRLSSSYKLKQSEHVLNFDNKKLTVSNTEEDKDVLLKRLLKYGENCKILKPKSMQEEFIALTNSILKNLEEE